MCLTRIFLHTITNNNNNNRYDQKQRFCSISVTNHTPTTSRSVQEQKKITKGSSSLSSDRISKSLYCTHSVLLGSLKRERVKSTLSAVLKAVEILVQVTPWNVWNPKNLVRVMKSLRTHIGSARRKRGHDGKGEESSDQSCSESDTTTDPRQRRERQQHTYTAAMKVMNMAILATKSSEIETYICSNTSRYGPLVNEILSTHTSIDLERLALGSSLAKSFQRFIRHWDELNSFLQNAFCSSNHKIRTEGLRIAGSLFRGEVKITSKKNWTNLVMQTGDAVQDPSSLVRVIITGHLNNTKSTPNFFQESYSNVHHTPKHRYVPLLQLACQIFTSMHGNYYPRSWIRSVPK